MTNDQLKAFLAVVEQGSFRKAAEAIFKTQAAVSSSIKSLELEYSIKLFDRSQYRPVLTEEGRGFFHQAKLTMEHFNRLDRIGQQLTKGVELNVNIVVSLAFPFPPLLKQIKAVVEQFPHTHFKVLTESLNGVAERIDAEDADIAFGPDIGLNYQHEKVAISEVTFVNVAAPGYFKYGRELRVSQEEIAAYSQIIVRDSGKAPTTTSFSTVPTRESWSVNDFSSKKDLILAGFGWGSLPRHLIEEELTAGDLVPAHVEGISVESSGALYMFRNRNHQSGPVANKIWQELIKEREALASLP